MIAARLPAAAIAGMLFAPVVAAQPPTAAATAVQAFIDSATAVCLSAPANRCLDAGWDFTDSDLDRRLSLQELEAVRAAVAEWFTWRRADLTRYERSAVTVGLGLVGAIGLDRLVASYDANGDRLLDRDELLADITRLDDRPLGEILVDPDSVDRAAMSRRLGALSPVLGGLLGE